MRFCYLRGVKLKSKSSSLGDDDCESLEHIIPNALGGIIKSEDILSHKANQDLNNSIDKQFNKIFDSFSARLGIEKDRPTNPAGIPAFHLEYNQDVVIKNGKYCAKRPFYDPEKKIIYASMVAGENYEKHLRKSGKISQTDKVKIVDDIAGEFQIPFSLNNNVFKLGIAKIAAGFAAVNGVSRENLCDVIDLSKEKFMDRIIVSPFIPTAPAELLIEEAISESSHYPAHVLILHGDKTNRLLYCYVELFSTFQWYVLLSQDYSGDDINESYTYDLLNSVEINYESYIRSAPIKTDAIEDFKKYKRINAEKFIALSHVIPGKLREYNHFKFRSLEAIANYISASRKSKELGLDLFD